MEMDISECRGRYTIVPKGGGGEMEMDISQCRGRYTIDLYCTVVEMKTFVYSFRTIVCKTV